MIGVFDSGVGGLTVLKALLGKLPFYDYIYLGDLARNPYGNKSDEVIYKYTQKAVGFLFSQGAEIIIVACNSASAKALRRLQQEYLPSCCPEKRVLGVIIPVVEEMGNIPAGKRVGIIGTRATISSRTYEKEIRKINPNLNISAYPTPLLVPLIEEGFLKRRETKMILRYYLRPLKKEWVDYLILGCTHYPLLQKEIQGIMGKKCVILDTPSLVAQKFVDYLKRHPEMEKRLGRNQKRLYYTTDNLENFQRLGERFLGESLGRVKRADLDN